MYKGYRIRSDDVKLQGLLRNIDAEEITADVPRGLADYLRSGGEFDGEKVEDNFFPTDLQFDVFISHFHRDARLARKLAAYLKNTFKLRVFLDFQYWGCYTELLAEIDKNWNCDKKYAEHGFKKGELLEYEKCTFSSSVMHMMLGVALAKVIQSTECVIFLYSENEKLTDSYKKNKYDEIELGSPWVYHELWMTKLLASSTPSAPRIGKVVESAKEDFTLKLKAPVDRLLTLNGAMLKAWKDGWEEQQERAEGILLQGNALDLLYAITGQRDGMSRLFS